MSKAKIEALYDAILKHAPDAFPKNLVSSSKDTFVEHFQDLSDDKKATYIKSALGMVPKDNLFGAGVIVGKDTNSSRKAAITEAYGAV
jgi:hypothetical protein